MSPFTCDAKTMARATGRLNPSEPLGGETIQIRSKGEEGAWLRASRAIHSGGREVVDARLCQGFPWQSRITRLEGRMEMPSMTVLHIPRWICAT